MGILSGVNLRLSLAWLRRQNV